MTGHQSSAGNGRLPSRGKHGKEVGRKKRRRPLPIAGALGAGGGGGLFLYVLKAHGVIHWPGAPATAAAWTVCVGIPAVIVFLATHLVRLVQERKEGQVRLEHERRAGHLMLSRAKTFDQAKEAYDRVRGTATDPDVSPWEQHGEDPADPDDQRTDQEALTSGQRTPLGRNWTLMRGPVGRADLGTACSQVRWQLPPITSRSPCPSR